MVTIGDITNQEESNQLKTQGTLMRNSKLENNITVFSKHNSFEDNIAASDRRRSSLNDDIQ